MSKVKTVFFCTACGNESPKWQGKCPACGQWNTYQEHVEKPTIVKEFDGGSAIKSIKFFKI